MLQEVERVSCNFTRDALRSQRASTMGEFAFRRYHANQWTSAEEAWLPSGVWTRLSSDERPAASADAWVAVDAALKYDTTACVWATKLEDGRVFLEARVGCSSGRAPPCVSFGRPDLEP
jgi:hypothetical protein